MYEEMDVRAGDVRLHTGCWPAKGPAVICLHGLTANHLSFATMARPLSKAGFRVLAPDLRGRGKSDKPAGPYGPDAHVGDVLAMMNALEMEKVILLGHSLGAGIALRAAARAPERFMGLVIMDGGGVLSFGAKLKILAAIRPSLNRLGRVFPDEETYLRLFEDSPLFDELSQDTRAHFLYELEQVDGGVRCNIPREVIEAELQAQGGSLSTGKMILNLLLHPMQAVARNRAAANPPYDKLTMPTMIFKAGKHNLQPGDDLLPAEAMERMLREIPNAKGMTIAGANHYGLAADEIPERDEALADFMKNLPV